MLPALGPVNGDFVVRQKTRDRTLVYTLYTAPGPDQYLLHTREETVAQALTAAKRARVRAWFAQGEADFVLLGEFQVAKCTNGSLPTSVGSAVA
jgi:hypothetical protein